MCTFLVEMKNSTKRSISNGVGVVLVLYVASAFHSKLFLAELAAIWAAWVYNAAFRSDFSFTDWIRWFGFCFWYVEGCPCFWHHVVEPNVSLSCVHVEFNLRVRLWDLVILKSYDSLYWLACLGHDLCTCVLFNERLERKGVVLNIKIIQFGYVLSLDEIKNELLIRTFRPHWSYFGIKHWRVLWSCGSK